MELVFEKKHHYRYDEAAHITPNSELYRAMDLVLNRNVALKKVKIQGEKEYEISENLKIAQREVSAMVQITELTAKIPNIYCTYFDRKEKAFYVIMQWLGGETLGKKMERGVSNSLFLQWMQQLCRILEVMAGRRFQHKDIKPDNIMFNAAGDLYLIDFNISVSVPNQVEGTPLYRAPEMEYGSVTMSRDRVDMFALGVLLYRQFTGKIPQRMVDYEIYDVNGRSWDFFTEPKAVKPEISDRMNCLIVRLMAYRPEDRFKNYGELLRELKAAEEEERNARRGKQGGRRTV